MLYPNDCDKCDLCINNHFKPSHARGNMKAPIMIIGEAPTSRDFKEDTIFSDISGHIVQDQLRNNNLMSLVYLTNAVKCFPPMARSPLLREINVCNKYLMDELIAIKPRIVVLLGRIATNSFFGKDVFKDLVEQQVMEVGDLIIVIGLKPSHVIRNPETLPDFAKTFRIVAALYRLKCNPIFKLNK